MPNKPSLITVLKTRNLRLHSRIVHLEGELICARHRIKALESERKQILEVDGPKTLRVSFDSRAVDPLKLAAKKERLVSIIK